MGHVKGDVGPGKNMCRVPMLGKCGGKVTGLTGKDLSCAAGG